MNKVIDVSSRDCTCLLEPGVTYFALYEHLQKNGFQNLWIDNPDLGELFETNPFGFPTIR